MPKAGISHDPKDAPHFTNKVFTVYWSFINAQILAIQDDDRTHYPFLKQWVGMEVDLENQFSINNGTLGMEVYLHNANKHEMHYLVRLKIEDAELIVKTEHNVVGVIDGNKRLLYAFRPINISQLEEFIEMKKYGDKKVKEKNYGLYGSKGWTIQ